MNYGMQTFTGRIFFPHCPDERQLNLLDISHHLSMICRFTGAVRRFYSVAEHSVHVSLVVPPEHAFTALLHDATEAYINDLSRPLKQHLSTYQAFEREIWRAIAQRYDLPAIMPSCIKDADTAVLVAEMNKLMPGPKPNDGGLWYPDRAPAQVKIRALSPDRARYLFWHRLAELRPDLYENEVLNEWEKSKL